MHLLQDLPDTHGEGVRLLLQQLVARVGALEPGLGRRKGPAPHKPHSAPCCAQASLRALPLTHPSAAVRCCGQISTQACRGRALTFATEEPFGCSSSRCPVARQAPRDLHARAGGERSERGPGGSLLRRKPKRRRGECERCRSCARTAVPAAHTAAQHSPLGSRPAPRPTHRTRPPCPSPAHREPSPEECSSCCQRDITPGCPRTDALSAPCEAVPGSGAAAGARNLTARAAGQERAPARNASASGGADGSMRGVAPAGSLSALPAGRSPHTRLPGCGAP